jgi:hypothetical protein
MPRQALIRPVTTGSSQNHRKPRRFVLLTDIIADAETCVTTEILRQLLPQR